ncbi:MAG: transglutaminase-like domain-containing protein [Clostridiaceae bacterium]|nr:transglutaminase-like domain-containing protein [Clostridiaceae bacterium]
MKRKLLKRLFPMLLLTAATVGLLMIAAAADIPTVEDIKTGEQVYANSMGEVDYSNLSEGFVSVRYTGGKNVRIKVQITCAQGTTYTYNLNNSGDFETFPLVEGDGEYIVKLFENTYGTRYAQALSLRLTLSLRNEFLPFLYPNQYVNYTQDSQTVTTAAELVKDQTTDLQKLGKIYRFVVDTLTYDYEKAENVQSGYLPVLDDVLESKTGICFDYAALMAAMLRSQGIPCKLVVGYAGTVYHAWINVYLREQGWVEHAIYFDGTNWKLMDPTFASTGKSSIYVLKYIGNVKNYSEKYAY